MKRIYCKDNCSRLILGLIFLVAANACSVKKEAFNRIEIHKDSTHSFVDTSYHSKEVTFKIDAEEDSDINPLVFSQVEFNRYIDSLFTEIDTAFDRKQVIRTIIKTKGLWNTDTSSLETTLAKSIAIVNKGELCHFLYQKDTTLKQRYDSLLQVISKEREIWHNREVIESSETIKRSGFNFKIIAIILIILVIAWIILKRLI